MAEALGFHPAAQDQYDAIAISQILPTELSLGDAATRMAGCAQATNGNGDAVWADAGEEKMEHFDEPEAAAIRKIGPNYWFWAPGSSRLSLADRASSVCDDSSGAVIG